MPKVKRKTPGKKIVVHYKKKKPKIAKCAICKKPLHGIPRDVSKIRKLAKSKKRPNRPYGGYLCSNCLKELLREKIRKMV